MTAMSDDKAVFARVLTVATFTASIAFTMIRVRASTAASTDTGSASPTIRSRKPRAVPIATDIQTNEYIRPRWLCRVLHFKVGVSRVT